jgi:hypothetical protein
MVLFAIGSLGKLVTRGATVRASLDARVAKRLTRFGESKCAPAADNTDFAHPYHAYHAQLILLYTV